MRLGLGLGLNKHRKKFRNNWYLEFDGSSDYVSISSMQVNTFTVSFYIKVVSGTSEKAILGGSNSRIAYRDNVTKNFEIRLSGTNYNTTYNQIVNADWHHIVFTRSGTTLKYYYDTTLIDTITVNTNDLEFKDIGKYLTGRYMYGNLDEIAIYNRELTTAEIATLYGGGTPQTCGDMRKISGLVAGWRFEEGTGTLAKDVLGSNNGTLVGPPEWKQYG